MRKKNSGNLKEFPFLDLFERFINDSKSGRRIQPNGKAISNNTINNYIYTRKLLTQFCLSKNCKLRLRSVRRLGARQIIIERNYWKKFYRKFTFYLYKDRGFYDNYVGHNIKIIRVFFNYLNKDLLLDIGEFHKSFYVRKEEVPIVVLMPEELNLLVFDKEFEYSLTPLLRKIKDIFVFGCTVALRVSDLLNLHQSNLRLVNDRLYLIVRSQKKGKYTQIRLPQHAIEIINKYRGRYKTLLPQIHKVNLNIHLKRLMERAGFTQTLKKFREKRGAVSEIVIDTKTHREYRFCDLVSSHTMRRTAITTMLSLGMPEFLVRTISGHSPGSKEFFRYVSLAQSYQDSESLKVFEILRNKEMRRIDRVVS